MHLSVVRSFTISRALVLLFAFLGFAFLPVVQSGFSVPLPESTPWYLSIWYQWDAHWYMSISMHGYEWVAGDQSNVAFFPLYPMVVKIFGLLLGGNHLLVGILLSTAFFFAALIYFFRLVRDDFGEIIADRAIWFLSIFPASLFFTTLYTESLFLLTSVASFYYARRGRWALAGIWGFLAALTKVTGFFIFIPLVYEYMSQRSFSLQRLRPSMMWVVLVPTGLLVYMGYLYFSFGLPLAFAQTQAAGWGHEFKMITGSLSNDLSILIRQWEIWVVYEIGAVLLLAVMIFIGIRKKLPGTYIVYMLITLIFPLTGGTTKSMSRYLLMVFPMFIIMALLTEKPAVRWAVSAVSIVLLAVSTAAFVTGRWVA